MNIIRINSWSSDDKSAYIIAELSANHNQNIENAKLLINEIKNSGANAIKLQTYKPDTMTINCDSEQFIISGGSPWEGKKLYDLYAEAMTPWEWHEELFSLAKKAGLDCFSTPFDKTSVDFLETFDPPAYKIASFEMIDLELIDYIASKKRPIILSTGMGSLKEISEAVELIQSHKTQLALLKCTSAYPAPPESMNLNTIPHLKNIFNLPVGLSDHTLGTTAPIAAITLGASIIEKHVTISRKNHGPDSAFSLEIDEFNSMVKQVTEVKKSLGEPKYGVLKEENGSKIFRRSLYLIKDINKGEHFSKDNVKSIRPGYGLAPKHIEAINGRTALKYYKRGTPLSWDMLA